MCLCVVCVQYPFHMESHVADANVVDGKLQVRASVQAPRWLQQTIAGLLKRQENTVEVRERERKKEREKERERERERERKRVNQRVGSSTHMCL